MNHPFQPLVGPLQYACRHDFAQLAKVKDLRTPLASALAAAPKAGVDAAWVRALERELPQVDHASPEVRKASLRRILGTLRRSGLSLPTELITLSSDAETALTPPPTAAPKAPSGPALRKPRKPQGELLPREKVARKLPSEPIRALSIAPASGPLAAPLASFGGKRLSPRLVSALKRRGLTRVGDALFLLPRAYEDRRALQRIGQLRPGERVVFLGVVKAISPGSGRGGRSPFRAVIADGTGSVTATFFQGGAWLKGRFPIGKRLLVSGELRAHVSGWEVAHPDVEPADDAETSSVHFHRIVPVYPGFERHEQRAFRELAHRVVERHAEDLEDPIPAALRARLGLESLPAALRRIHFPSAEEDLEALESYHSTAHRRLAFDELFFLQLGMALRRKNTRIEPGQAFDTSPERLARAASMLPFTLTPAQARVVEDIRVDMARAEPMSRLIQGDVGSGKTAVAAVAAALAIQDGAQVAVMAPTEILAEQHRTVFDRWLSQLGFKTVLLTAGGTAKQRREQREALAAGRAHVAVGTHALIQEGVDFQRLGLVVIDEQHRFGVIQRQALMGKGVRPDTLVLTATPIPRTLAMTLYGDLDVSVIDGLPPGRTPVATRVYPDTRRAQVYQAVAAELRKGHQAYVIYPLVEESEKVDLADATQGAQTLRTVFPDVQVGLLHGRMSPAEKDEVMEAFRSRRTQLLVSTTVVEVGVDVPNATAMVIESAERFGLSQLHQLRGRVGRGAAASSCFLVVGNVRSHEATERLAVMERTNDGFKIAEKDLEIRGPGEFLGTRQSGLPELAVANLARDVDLLAIARREALALVEQDPALRAPEHRPLVKALEERWKGRLALARVG
ncbi:MAG TPA: ATP-dependent DNA helicase RecG [Myxococcaceae bacterium]|nr:ATP-dependent DNA helicase RecG [Myxococcaceae bacterium]